MSKYRIYEWEEIKDEFTDKLLLGNGASRAVWDSFEYRSLYEEAESVERISPRLAKLFLNLGTNDFEYVLRLLSQTRRVNQILQIRDEYTSKLYRKLKRALIDTIHEIHPKHEQVKSQLPVIAEFMKSFDTVLSLNYDLLVYWAMMEGNDKYGNWFKDGFIEERRFDNDYEKLRESYKAEGATLVFYPHGNLILATTFLGDEVKLSRADEKLLLDRILEIWQEEDHIPLFVSEGETQEKVQAIRRSNYLKTVYDCEVETKNDSLVIYGWSFGEQDEHILRGIIHGGVDRIAISVHTTSGNIESFCNTVQYKIAKMKLTLKKKEKCRICFFDSESDGVWNKAA